MFGRYQSRIVAPLILAGIGAGVLVTRRREHPALSRYAGLVHLQSARAVN